MATITKTPKPRLNSLDDLLKLNDTNTGGNVTKPFPQEGGDSTERQSPPDTEYATVPFDLMDDYPGHPFRRYAGQRKDDMVESIKEHGILQPLLLRPAENGRYHIMAGHNRKDNGMEAGLSEAPAVIKHNLTDAEAWVYVIETNLIQRSFSDMLPSEKAAVLALRHSKMVSQGKRNDILSEIKQLENPDDTEGNSTYEGNHQKFHTREALAEEYGLAPYNVAKYLRADKLIDPLKERLDNRELALYPAAELSFLTQKEQRVVEKCLDLNNFKIDMKKADTLRDYSKRKKLDDESAYLVLNGEVGQAPKKNRTPTVKVAKEVYSKYFTPQQTAKEVQGIVEKALDFYHVHMQKPSREPETMPQTVPLPDNNGGEPDNEEYEMEP